MHRLSKRFDLIGLCSGTEGMDKNNTKDQVIPVDSNFIAFIRAPG